MVVCRPRRKLAPTRLVDARGSTPGGLHRSSLLDRPAPPGVHHRDAGQGAPDAVSGQASGLGARFGSGSQVYTAAGVLYVGVVRHDVAGGPGAGWHEWGGSTSVRRPIRGRRRHIAGMRRHMAAGGAGDWSKYDCPTNCGGGQPRRDALSDSVHTLHHPHAANRCRWRWHAFPTCH